jgi:cell division protein FtsI/penicillin-binding protein 2
MSLILTEIDIKKKRLILLGVLATLLWLALVGRLVQIQLVHGSEYTEKARRQTLGKREIEADRGIIYDRTGKELAINVFKNILIADPEDQAAVKHINAYLDKLFGKSRGYAAGKYNLQSGKSRPVDRDLPDALAEKVKNDNVPGLFITKGTKRSYPLWGVGQQLVGFTDIDGRGIAGLEYSYDSVLTGKPGLIDYLRDGQRNTYRIRELPLVAPVRGNSIILTIDWNFQEIVEEELKAAVEKYKALEGTAIFIDCRTGEVLAAADCVADGKNDPIKLRAVSNAFEPGSVFKVFTAASILDENKARPTDQTYCENGAWKCGPRVLHDDHRHGLLTFQEIIEKSSNIGTAKMALRIGGKKLSEGAHRFGFGQRYFVGLPGEASGSIGNPGKWSDYNVAALAMGHSVSVTALQLATGMAAVANGGKLYRPRVIKAILDSQGKPIKEYHPEIIANVVKPESARILREFLVGVVERGTGTPVKSKSVAIAGKTGTAEVATLGGGGYKKNKFVASFMGYFPAEDPKIAGVIVLHQPEPIHYGGYTSGPTFKNIAERYVAANPDRVTASPKIIAVNDQMDLNIIPDFTGREVTLAQTMARKLGMDLVCNAPHGIIAWQYPISGRKTPGSGKVVALVAESELDSLAMVDLTGLNLRTAISLLNFQGLDFEIEGSGIVDSQIPHPGATVDKEAKCRLICRRGSINEDTVKKSN